MALGLGDSPVKAMIPVPNPADEMRAIDADETDPDNPLKAPTLDPEKQPLQGQFCGG